MSEKCSAECACRGRFLRWYPCDKPAKVTRDGKPYCLRHDPERVKAKRDARLAISDAKWNKRMNFLDRQSDCVKACEGMKNPVADVEYLRAEARSKQVVLARGIATVAHLGQRYGNGPYIRHPEGVAEIVARMKDATTTEIAAAWLHDVIEDTPLRSMDLIFAGVDLNVITLVEILTRHKEDESYADYIVRVSKDKSAIKIKLADLEFNLAHSPSAKQYQRYSWARKYLEEMA